jgi:hypothetical protein
MRLALITAILVLWLGSLVALFYPSAEPEPALPAPLRTAGAGGTEAGEWWGIYMQGRKIGFVHHRLDEGAEVAFQEESVLRLTTLGERQTVRTTAAGTMSRAYELRDLQVTLAAGPTRLRVQAAMRDGELWVTSGRDGEEKSTTRLHVPRSVSVSMGLRRQATHAPLEVGRVVRGAVFDPLTRTSSPLTLVVGQRQPLPGQPDSMAWRIEEEWRNVMSVLWVDDDGRLLREEGPMGLLALREPKAQATDLGDTDQDWDAVQAVSIPVHPPIDAPRTRPTLRVRLSGIAPERIPSGDGQSVDGAEVLIRRSNLGRLGSYTVPYQPVDHARELEPTANMQSDDPRIVTLAATILSGERDAVAATRRLVDWVYHYLEKTPTASIPDALQVLDSGQGDCNEHAVLFAALARAAGIPARVVNGAVYGEGAFLYHAWNEIWLGRWVGVDAALNQVPADATHIKLIADEGDAHVLMMSILGNLRIEVLGDEDRT